MIIEGGGLLAKAFAEWGDTTLPGLLFARGVADSSLEDDAQYRRELALLGQAMNRSIEAGIPIVYFAGAPIYGSFEAPVREDSSLQPRTRYGRHQAEAEELIRASGARHLLLRLPNVVGPRGHQHQLVPALVRHARAGLVRVQGGAARDLIDARDMVRIVDALLAGGIRDVTLNVASGISSPVELVVDRVCQVLGVSPRIERVEGGENQRFDISRLQTCIQEPSFDPDYPSRTLETWVPVLAKSTVG
jgi:NDP-hexose 4-ketoreductase